MKWKDKDNKDDGHNSDSSDAYYEDDGYASFKEKGSQQSAILTGNPVRYLYWGLGIAVIVGVVLMLMLFFANRSDPVDMARMDAMEKRIQALEQQLEKYAGVDEKVTRIWEQAKSFETFKTRFDRSEASMSLRMDHLAMSLDTLQKKNDDTLKKIGALSMTATPKKATAAPPTKRKTVRPKTHKVAAGDTLFNISRRYNLSVAELRSMNKLNKGSVIHIGQVLTVGPTKP